MPSAVDAVAPLSLVDELPVPEIVDFDVSASDSISEARSSASFLAASIGGGGMLLLPTVEPVLLVAVPELEVPVPSVLADELAPAFC